MYLQIPTSLPGTGIKSEIGCMIVKNLASRDQNSRDSGQRLFLAVENVYFSGISLRPKNSGRLLEREP